ncbi:MAG TPA: PP2C family protein-serine/threonine phosphatase [Gemmataceae bacterium]|nr:PP2C family protein-serine/threonine phosphatase [Gemmataceae bacterium]
MPKPRPSLPRFSQKEATTFPSPAIRRGRFRERVRPDAKPAREVQQSLLPAELPQVPGYQFYAYYEPAQEVGGDYYDFIPLPSPAQQERLAILLGDVAGKGVPAALLMAKLSSDARSCLHSHPDPAAAITALNDLLYPHTSQIGRFVTLAAAILDANAHTLTLVNAGHPAPVIYHRSMGMAEEATCRDAAGLPLGIVEGFVYQAYNISLRPGDCILLYSDGVTDQLDKQNNPIQHSSLRAACQEGIGAPQALGESIIKILKHHTSKQRQHDDITLVCFGRTAD